MKRIPLTKGIVCLVDDADFALVSRWKWFADSQGYAARTEYLGGGRRNRKRYRTVRMHRVLLNVPPGLYVDHINGNTADNRRINLRPATKQQNGINHRKRQGCSSRFKGVQWRADRRRWLVKVQVARKQVLIGHFRSERAAAMAYDLWTLDLNGQFASPNFRPVLRS